MRPDQWVIDGYHPLLLVLGAVWLLLEVPGALAAVRDLILRRPLYPGGQMYITRLVRCAPVRTGWRHHRRSQRRGPAMPDESDVTRITGSHWPPPYVEPPATQGFPNPGEPRRPDRRGLVVGGLALVGTLAVFALAGGGYVAYAKLSASSTFDAHGMLVLRDVPDGIMSFTTQDNQCAGYGGYSDITEGAPVVVKDAAGKTVAEGQLQQGVVRGGCSFQFLVKAIPDGSKFYSFEVSHRGAVTVTRADAAQPRLTLGS